MAKVLVTGAGGFIGGHLSKRLAEQGHDVWGADIKMPEFRSTEDIGIPANQFIIADLRYGWTVEELMYTVHPEWIFALAADMGGMGFISSNDERILRNNLAINLNTYRAAHDLYLKGFLQRYFFSSSVCVYPEHAQMDKLFTHNMLEGDAHPAAPQDAYGWEKLTTEQLLLAAHQDLGFPTYIARFHNCYGPYGTWQGGREKAPAAMCRKVANIMTNPHKEPVIEVWGDGQQIRPFVYVDDLVEAILLLTQSDYHKPVNLGPTWTGPLEGPNYRHQHIVSIDTLAAMVAKVAGLKHFSIEHVDGPEGVRYRGADGSLMKRLTGWEPSTPLLTGLSLTYEWIEQQVLHARMQGAKA
jgi:nucleoside-diphosphate-sugar epimerase